MKLIAVAAASLLCLACQDRGGSTVDVGGNQGGVIRRDEPPVPIDPETPVSYPDALYAQRISGTVLLRLFLTETGQVVSESTRVQESSGWPALDSAALAAAPRLRYAPALRNGVPVATLFTQPIHFRHPDRGGTTP